MEYIIVFLSILVIVCIVLIISKDNKIKYYKSNIDNLPSTKIIKCMFEIIGADISGDEKIIQLNNIILDAYKCGNSSIVVFDGHNYNLKASNIEENYNSSMLSIYKEDVFKENLNNKSSKYVTASKDKILNYSSAVERDIKSCIFSPIYHGDLFLGYWVIEDSKENYFESITKSELYTLKKYIGILLESILYQELIESVENIDKQTGLNNLMYLYSTGRKELLKYDDSCLCMLEMTNLADINVEYSRDKGNILFNKVIQLIKEHLKENVIKVRYSGTRILIIYPNSTSKSVHSNIEKLLSKIKSECIINEDNKMIELNVKIVMHNIKKQNNIEKQIDNVIKYINNVEDENIIKII